jgi:hypothetical protein
MSEMFNRQPAVYFALFLQTCWSSGFPYSLLVQMLWYYFDSHMFQVEDLWMGFHEILYEYYSTIGHHRLVRFRLLHNTQTLVSGWGVLGH